MAMDTCFVPLATLSQDVERVLASGHEARYLLLNDRCCRYYRDRVRGRIAIRRGGAVRRGRAGSAVLVPGRDGEVLRILRHVLEGTADCLVGARLERLEVRAEVSPLIVRRDIAEGSTAGAIA